MTPKGLRRWTPLAIYGAMVVLLACAAVWVGFDMVQGRHRIIAEKTSQAVQKSQFMSQWFGTTILSVDYVLRDINTDIRPDMLNATGTDPEYFSRLSSQLRKKLDNVPSVARISIYDQHCVFRASADARAIGQRSGQKACAEPGLKLEDRLYVQYVPAERSASRQASILISRQHISPEGRLLGGALAAMDLSYAQRWIMGFAIDTHDILAMVDADGIMLARNPPLPGTIGMGTRAPEMLEGNAAQRSTTSFSAVSRLDGRERLYGLSKIENVPIVVIVGIDLTAALEEWERRAWQLAAGFLGLLGLSGLAMRTHLTALRQREAMRTLATTDSLTAIANRRHLVEGGEQAVARVRRYGGDVALMMVDIDRFKTINDTWGHPTGDRAIQALARTMGDLTREVDIIGRLGGEEFAAVLPGTDRDGAATLAERLRARVEQEVAAQSDDGQAVRFTISVGVTALTAGDQSFEAVLGRADKALYAAKTNGRNQVVVQ